ncbi:MAG: Ig-like domain-containing protein [Anaerolineaceae bacterium]|jgi:hypothetical protein
MRKRTLIIFLILFIFLALFTQCVSAQTEEPQWQLRLRRDWGYGMGSDIQGQLTLSLQGDTSQVEQVTFYFNDVKVFEQHEAPFRFSFNTDQFPAGINTMRADVLTRDGKLHTTLPLSYNFLSSKEANKNTGLLVGGIIGVALLITALSFVITSHGQGKDGKTGGMFGLAICKECGQTFPRSLFSMNVVVGKYERCPHCGKWQVTVPASEAEIAEANRASQPKSVPIPESSHERDELEESRFIDL